MERRKSSKKDSSTIGYKPRLKGPPTSQLSVVKFQNIRNKEMILNISENRPHMVEQKIESHQPSQK